MPIAWKKFGQPWPQEDSFRFKELKRDGDLRSKFSEN